MTTIKLEDVTEPMTTAYVESSLNRVLEAQGFSPVGWLVGHVIRSLNKGCAIAIAGVHQFVCMLARGGYIDLAEGQYLTLKAKYDWDTDRIEATQAVGSVQITNTTTNVYELDAFELTVASATSTKQYRNSQAFTLGANATVTVPILAIEQGSSSSASAGEITVIVTGGLTGCTATNPASVIGTDAEEDGSLRERAKQAPSLHSAANAHGAAEAIALAAQRADGSPIGVTRAHAEPGPLLDGTVNVYCTTASGTLSAPDLAAITTTLQQTIEGLAVNMVALAAIAKNVAFTLTVYGTGAVDALTLKSKVLAALAAFEARQNIGGVGGWLYVDQVVIAAGNADPSIIHVATDLSDTAIASNEYPVLAPSVTAVIS